MGGIQIFSNATFGKIRALEINREVLFVARDVAEKLGYKNVNDAISRHCKGVVKHDTLTSGGIQTLTFIPEGDVYRLIIKSRLKSAEYFEKWVMEEVLPQIRQTGGYIPVSKEDDEQTLMARAFLIAQKTLEQKDKLLEATKEELHEKNRFITQISSSENSILVRDVAKLASKNNIKIGERRLYQKLRDWDLIFKHSTEPKQKGIDAGYFEVTEGTRENYKGVFTYKTTKVTGKGQVYIIQRLLKEEGEYFEDLA